MVKMGQLEANQSFHGSTVQFGAVWSAAAAAAAGKRPGDLP